MQLIQLILSYKVICIKVGSDIPLQSLPGVSVRALSSLSLLTPGGLACVMPDPGNKAGVMCFMQSIKIKFVTLHYNCMIVLPYQ